MVAGIAGYDYGNHAYQCERCDLTKEEWISLPKFKTKISQTSTLWNENSILYCVTRNSETMTIHWYDVRQNQQTWNNAYIKDQQFKDLLGFNQTNFNSKLSEFRFRRMFVL